MHEFYLLVADDQLLLKDLFGFHAMMAGLAKSGAVFDLTVTIDVY